MTRKRNRSACGVNRIEATRFDTERSAIFRDKVMNLCEDFGFKGPHSESIRLRSIGTYDLRIQGK
jgi:hypothetical protein